MQAKQGEVTLAANLSDPGYKIELASAVPSIGLVRSFVLSMDSFPNSFSPVNLKGSVGYEEFSLSKFICFPGVILVRVYRLVHGHVKCKLPFVGIRYMTWGL